MATLTEEEFEKGLPQLSTGKLYQYLSDLCRFGTTWPGSREEILVRNYVFEKLSEAGLRDVHLEAFEYRNYTPVSAWGEVVSPTESALTCEPLEYSGNGEVEGEIIYVGSGSEEEFKAIEEKGGDFRGKIVLTRTNRSYFAYPRAEKWGAVGIIVITDAPNRWIRHHSARLGLREGESMDQYGGKIPGILIPIEDADVLWTLLSIGKVKVRLSHQGEYGPKTSWNVVGSILGVEEPAKKVAVGAHYDTQRVGCAWDNAVGVAGLIELARVMAPLHPKRTVVFCAFGCEEVGLFGSSAFVKKHSEDMENYLAYINLDSTSAEVAPVHQLYVTPRVRDFAFQTITTELNWRIDRFQDITPNEYSCDYVEFLKQDVEVIWASEQGNPFFHTKGDTLDTIDAEQLNKTTTVNGLCLFKLAYMGNPPARHHRGT